MFEHMRENIQGVSHHDPAAHNTLKVLIRYPDLHAVWLHRLAHGLWTSGWKWLTRLVSDFDRWMIGVEIHPEAKTGRHLLIDYGMGIVISETAEIDDDVTLYQGVILGGATQDRGKHHSTLGSNMMISAGTKALGPFTIGEGTKVGSNAMVTKEIPPGATVVGIPERIIIYEDIEQQVKHQAITEKLGFNTYGVGQGMPDPVTHAIGQLLDHLQAADGRLGDMCQTLIALGSGYHVKDLPVLREENLTGTRDEDGNPAA